MSVQVPEYGGCSWPTDSACFTEEWEAFDDDVKDRSIALASATLQRLTGNRVGACPVTVRPCKPSCASLMVPYLSSFGTTVFHPQINPLGQWVNSCRCTHNCSCTEVCQVALPAPVGRIDEVRVNGSVLNSDEYQIDNGNLLTYLGDDCPWPACQDLSAPDTEPGTFSVTYLNAYPVDSIGAYAAGVMAMEFARACAGNNCRLPSGVSMIVRQGVTLEIASGAFPDGLTGIREVDLFISLYNPRGLARQATVWSPDIPRVRMTTANRPPYSEVYDGGDPDDWPNP